MSRSTTSGRRLLTAAVSTVSATAILLAATSCSSDTGATAAGVDSTAVSAGTTNSSPAPVGTDESALTQAELFDSSLIHTIAVEYDESEYQAMIDTFVETGTKEWISATVTIDGTVFTNVGIKLKGNSTLQGLRGANGGPAGFPGGPGRPEGQDSEQAPAEPTGAPAESTEAPTTESPAGEAPSEDRAPGRGGFGGGGFGGGGFGGPGGDVSADEPEGLPWRIRLDKFEKGQNYQGQTDIVVRGGSSETSLNEAVALEVIGAAGMPTQEAISTRFSVNGSEQTLRLVIQNPNDVWYAENFDNPGILYKAEAEGDYSYRGENPDDYLEAFEIEAASEGLQDDYTPLIAFLKFINEADDATFAAELGNYLEIDSFADYLAVQELVDNFDDIDGPGNNSYLQYDATTEKFTVVSWDQNLSYGGMGGGVGGPGGGGRPGAGGMTPPTDGSFPTDMQFPPNGEFPADGEMPDFGGGFPGRGDGDAEGGFGGRGLGGNILAERFNDTEAFAAMYEDALTELTADLYTSGVASDILDTWTSLLLEQATDLVPADTITAESEVIAEIISGR